MTAPTTGMSAVERRPEEVDGLYRRTLAVVVVSQVFGGAGVAGLPAALFTRGSAVAAYTVGRVSQRSARIKRRRRLWRARLLPR